MPKDELIKAVKFWGSFLIIGAAALIMMPGLLTYLMGLSRILLIIVITLVVATIAGNIIFRLRRVQSKQSGQTSNQSAGEAVPSDTTQQD